MSEFNRQLLRFKEATGETEDQGVAKLLGLSKAAFSDRKKRDSFPIKEVYALAHLRPELKLDVDWIITGHSAYLTTATKIETSLVQAFRLCSAADRQQIFKLAIELSQITTLPGSEVVEKTQKYFDEIELNR